MEKEIEIPVDENLIAFCGLYCGACPRYLKKKCKGCKDNDVKWCKVKPCNKELSFKSCADCKEFTSVAECKKYNPLFVRLFEYLSGSKRKDGVKLIKEIGYAEYASYMAKNKLVSIKKEK